MLETPVQQPQTTQTQKVNWKRVGWIVAAAIVILATLIGLWWWFFGRVPKEVTTSVTPPTTKTSTPSAKQSTPSAKKDETAGWVVFKD